MFDRDHWQEIKTALAANKLRTLLTAFSVFWGSLLLMVLLGSGYGLSNGMLAEFSGAAVNSFFVWSGRTGIPYRGLPAGREVRLTTDDVEAIRTQIPEAAVIAPTNRLGNIFSSADVTHGSKSGAFAIWGNTPEYLAIESFRVTSGRFINPLDLKELRKVAIIGSRVRQVLFGKTEDPIGQSIGIKGVSFQVVGVFKTRYEGARSSELAQQTIFVPLTTFGRVFNAGNEVRQIAATAREGLTAAAAEEKVISLLKKRHSVAPGDKRAIDSFNNEEEYNKLTGLFAGVAILLWMVGTGTLAAGAISVSNIMLIAVKERTKEIGIRRAIGARPASIMAQIVFEALALTMIAGYLGLVTGVALVEGANDLLPTIVRSTEIMFKDPGVELLDALSALAILVGAGVIAGLVPARQAIKISPVMALRGE